MDESDGLVTVTVESGPGYTVSATAGTATAVISDDDASPDAPTLIPRDATAVESAGVLEFSVELSSSSVNTVTVKYCTYAVGDNAASWGFDYQRVWSDILTFAPGETRQTIQIVLMDDQHAEDTEVMWISFFNPINVKIVDHEAKGTIIDDD